MEYDQEFERFAKKVREELIPMIDGSRAFVSIVPLNKDKVDVKFAVELGLGIMYNKPIIAVIRPGTEIPEKLSRVVDRFVEWDFKDPTGQQRIMDAIKELGLHDDKEEE